MRKQRVAHLSSVHPVFDVRIFHKECTSLANAGFDVVLIARGEEDHERNGVRVRVLPVRAGGRLKRMTLSVMDLFRMAWRERADLYHLHDPELIPLGIVFKLLGKRVVIDVHENVPKDIRSKPWIPRALRGPVANAYGLFQRVAGRIVDAVIVATPGIAEVFPGSNTVVIQNFPRRDDYAAVEGRPYEERDPIAVYVGGLTDIRGIAEMVTSMEHLRPAGAVRLKLAGPFMPPTFRDELEQLPGWDAVDALGWLDRAQVAEVLSQSRVGLLTLLPAPNHLDSQPIKLFEYMGAGLPVVASDFPYWKQFVEDLGTGLMVDPHDPRAIAEATQWLLDHPAEAREMGERGRQAVMASCTWEQEEEKLISLYRELLGR